jgi:DNA-directed RNA polymerase subunit RPC12/RpoP
VSEIKVIVGKHVKCPYCNGKGTMMEKWAITTNKKNDKIKELKKGYKILQVRED